MRRLNRPRGYHSRCCDCLKAVKKADYEKHKPARLQRRKAYVLENREEIRQAVKRRNAQEEVKLVKRAYNQRYYQENREAILAYYATKAAERSAYNKAWSRRSRGKINQGKRCRFQTDAGYAIECRLRSRLAGALKQQGARKSERTMALVGCTRAELISHLESLFLPGMTWQNRHLWHVDHRRPCVEFDLTDPEQQRACFHYSNLQPLWEGVNRRKDAGRRRGAKLSAQMKLAA